MLSPQLQGASQTPLVESEELRALRSNQLHLKLEKGLLIYTYNGQGPARWVVPTNDHRGVMLTHAHDSGATRVTEPLFKPTSKLLIGHRCSRDNKSYVQGCLVCCQFQPS